MKTLLKTKSRIVTALYLAMLLSITSSFAQQSKNILFKQADEAVQNAKTMNADTLSLSVNLNTSAKIVYANSLNARQDALSARADLYAKELWFEAEEQFIKAAREIDNRNCYGSYKSSVEAIEIYKKAEVFAIKTNLLDETRKLLEKAYEMGVYDIAPKTLEKAKSLLLEAEKAIETNRYEMDYPSKLAKQANYEVLHAIFLYQTIKNINYKSTTLEDVILNSEIPLSNIAKALGIEVQFDKGFDNPKHMIVNNVRDLQIMNYRLIMDNREQYDLIKQLEADIEVMQNEKDTLNIGFKTEIGKSTVEVSKVQSFVIE